MVESSEGLLSNAWRALPFLAVAWHLSMSHLITRYEDMTWPYSEPVTVSRVARTPVLAFFVADLPLILYCASVFSLRATHCCLLICVGIIIRMGLHVTRYRDLFYGSPDLGEVNHFRYRTFTKLYGAYLFAVVLLPAGVGAIVTNR